MGKMAVLSKCCSVMGIRGWGKLMSGRRDSWLEGDSVGVADDWEIIVL